MLSRFALRALGSTDVPLQQVGLNPANVYHVFDFWSQTYQGTCTGCLAGAALDRGTCQVLAIVPDLMRPQLIASSRHVSMDAVSILSEQWSEGRLTLELAGVTGTQEDYWLHCPPSVSLANTWSGEADVLSELCTVETGLVIRLGVHFESKFATVVVSFEET